MTKPKRVSDWKLYNRRQLAIPAMIIFLGGFWMFVSRYLIKPNQSGISLSNAAENFWTFFITLLAAVSAYLLIRQFREKDMEYNSLFDCSPLPKWIFDKNTLRFLAVNQAAMVIRGRHSLK